MTMTIIACEQNSPEWLRARMGIPTASEFKTIIGVKKEASEKVTRRTYMHKLAGEIITGEPMDNYSNGHMERGHAMEDEARALYAFTADTSPERIGFIRNGNAGCSPDSLIGADGLLEIKTTLPHLLIDRLLKDEFPPEHKAQCQGQLWLAEREWLDIAIYYPKMPLFVKRTFRDPDYIATLINAVDAFNDELQQVIDRIRNYGGQRAAA